MKKTITVVAHHRHGVAASAKAYHYRHKIPLYTTACAGHCDCKHYAGLKLTFVRGPWPGKNVARDMLSGEQLPTARGSNRVYS